VFNHIAKTAQRMAPMVRRVMIVDPQETSARALGELVRGVCLPDVWAAPSNAKAMKLAQKVDPELIFCVLADGAVDGLSLTRTLRRSDLACRKAAVVLVSGEATPQAMLAARDAGAHEFLRRPFTAKDVRRRLEAALTHPRGWVEAVDYVGPDRRRFNLAEYQGPLKRLADHDAPRSVRIGEALKIIASALGALEREPAQALRALQAQTAELALVGAETGDARLVAANHELQQHLSRTTGGGRPDPHETAARAAALLSYAGREARAA
jgi:CheY-like chemotaxis protein